MLENQIPTMPVLIQDLGMMYATSTSKNKFRYGIYRCECGNEFKTLTAGIKCGHAKSCGCYNNRQASLRNKTHGLARHRIYKTWNNMIQRTQNPNAYLFSIYGGRGITVCERWKDVASFIEDMYPSYQEGLTIDRIDVDGNYEPSNCRWATFIVQQRNKRKLMVTNTSGYKGVFWSKKANKWMTQININGRSKYLGCYKTQIEAAKAYDKFVIENNLEHTINGVG